MFVCFNIRLIQSQYYGKFNLLFDQNLNVIYGIWMQNDTCQQQPQK